MLTVCHFTNVALGCCLQSQEFYRSLVISLLGLSIRMADSADPLCSTAQLKCRCCRQVFGNSPDETAYCRLYLNKESVAEAMLMIQPTLMSYG